MGVLLKLVLLWTPLLLIATLFYLDDPQTFTHSLSTTLTSVQSSLSSLLNMSTAEGIATTPGGNPSTTAPVINPFEGGSTFIPSNTKGLHPSPFTTVSPDSTIVVVGGGLAGLSSAVEVVDSYYSALYDTIKILAKESGFHDLNELFRQLQKLPDHSFHRLMRNNKVEVFSVLEQLALLRVVIIEKEDNLGGNSAKASSGINAVGTARQQQWFDYQNAEPSGVGGNAQADGVGMFDNAASFIYDTMKSSVSMEPPIWVKKDNHGNAGSTTNTTTVPTAETVDVNQDAELEAFLQPLSPYTPKLINTVIHASAQAIPFLEKAQVYSDVLEFAKIVTKRLFSTLPPEDPHRFPQPLSRRHQNTPPKHVALFLSKIAQLGGHTHPRTHRPGPEHNGKPMQGPELPIGVASIQSLSQRVLTWPYSDHVSTLTSTILQGLTHPAGSGSDVDGVVYTIKPTFNNTHNVPQHDTTTATPSHHYHLPAKHIILATGGYSASAKMLAKYAPNIAKMTNLPTTNGPWATGDGVNVVVDAGGATVGMDAVQIHPTSFVVPSNPFNKVNFLAPEALRGVGGLLLNFAGQRFVNELTTRDVAARAIYWEGSEDYHMSYLLLSAPCAKDFGGAINFYHSKGIFAKTTALTTRAQNKSSGEDNTTTTTTTTAATADVYAAIKKDLIALVQGFEENNVDAELAKVIATIHTTILPQDPTTLPTTLRDDITLQLLDLTTTMLKLSHPAHVLHNGQNFKFQQGPQFSTFLRNIYTTLTDYSKYNKETNPDPFKRNLYTKQESFGFEQSANKKEEFYVALITPAIHFTMGGLAIDTHARVLREEPFNAQKADWVKKVVAAYNTTHAQQQEQQQTQQQSKVEQIIDVLMKDATQPLKTNADDVISGLYAVGEVSGGLHGRNRLGGNSLLECVTMGRRAARYIVEQKLLPQYGRK